MCVCVCMSVGKFVYADGGLCVCLCMYGTIEFCNQEKQKTYNCLFNFNHCNGRTEGYFLHASLLEFSHLYLNLDLWTSTWCVGFFCYKIRSV